jgi:hypothetical protein
MKRMTTRMKELSFLYSLSRHEVVRQGMVADCVVEFEANEEFVVIVRRVNLIQLNFF